MVSTRAVPVHTNGQANGQPQEPLLPSMAACGKSRPVSWVIPGLIRENVVNVAQGKKGAGKSCFYAWAAAVWLGVVQVPGRRVGKPSGRRVLIASEEPYRDDIQPRLKALGVKLNSVLFMGKADGSGRDAFRLPDNYEVVERAIRRQEVGFFICDTLAHFLASGKTANDEGQIREALEPAIRLGENDNLTSLFTQHIRKTKADTKIEQGRGSGSITEVARCVSQLERKSVKPTAGEIECLASNAGGDGRKWSYTIPKQGKAAVFVLGPELDAGDGLNQEALDEAAELTKHEQMKEVLRFELKDGEKDTKDLLDIAIRFGVSDRTFWRAAADLKLLQRRVGNGKQHRSLWRLPRSK